MSTKVRVIPLAILLLFASGIPAAYAAKPKPKPKPKPKVTAPKSTTHVVIGTTQLEGEPGRFGETYTIGVRSPWSITVNSAEYSVGHLHIGKLCFTPKADQKMLVIHYTVHNPQKGEANMRYDFLPWTAIDAKNTNWEYIRALGAEDSKESVAVMMKPAQKMNVYTAIMVPAAGPIPKVMVKGSDDRVLRYYPNEMVNGKNVSPVKGLEAPFADPSDPSGMTALDKVPGKSGEYYPLDEFDIRLDGYAFTDGKVGDKEPKKGNRNLVISMTVKNALPVQRQLRYDWFEPKLSDADGMTVRWNGKMLSASRDASVDAQLDPGQEVGIRYYFELPSDLGAKSFSISQRKSRVYVFDVSDAK